MLVKARQLRRAAVAYLVVLLATNLYYYNYASLFALFHPRSDVRFNLYGDPQIEGDAKLLREPTTGKYDLLVNDCYLHHVYKSTIAALDPHYVVTMGDIFSSQWVDTEEYYKRIRRFKWISHQTDSRNRPVSGKHIYLTLAGNHDIGYGEETESYHINRYVNNFGPLNREWIIDVRQNGTSSDSRPHRVAILNAMNLDKTRNEQYRRQTWGFVRQLAAARRQTPDVPLILFLHIPLNKPGGVCVDLPETRYLNGFVDYQDYLSPVTSAYLLHCLAPTLVFNGHDHSGCLSAYSVDSTVKAPIVLSSTSRVINHIDDLCGMTFQELDAHQTELEPFIQDSISSISSKDMPKASSWTTVEVTVRSAMGAYGGAAGIFDIRRTPQDSLLQTAPAARVSNRDVVVQANGCEYQYREVPFANHLVIRVLLVVDLASFMVLSALFLVLR